jgi:hypothetical protein
MRGPIFNYKVFKPGHEGQAIDHRLEGNVSGSWNILKMKTD